MSRRTALGLEGEAATPPPPVILENPPAVSGRRYYAGQLAYALRVSDWQSPQKIMLGEVLCKSPDRLTVIRVGHWDIWHREYRSAVKALSQTDQDILLGFLHKLARTHLVDGEWITDEPPPESNVMDVMERLWALLARRGHLHPQTRNGSTTVGP